MNSFRAAVRSALPLLLAAASSIPALSFAADASTASRRTGVSIKGADFHINQQPTYKGRVWNGHRIEGLLMNSRMVQGIFDDLNPDTQKQWAYPDTGKWDAERNTREFVAAMPEWRRHGLLAFDINLQGGSPQGYSRDQPWHNSAIEADGSLRADYLARLERIINKADELGMVVMLGYFYFGQDQRLKDEAAVLRATDGATKWLLEKGWRNVLVEINNECNVRYDHNILKPDRVHELIERVKRATRDGRHLLVGTSYGGNTIPRENVVRASDYLLLHGNGVSNPDRIAEMVRLTRAVSGYTAKPILFNEDDHFDFDKPRNNFTAAVGGGASWGYFDFRMKDEGFDEGYQSVPVNWGIASARKRGFFKLLAEITGAADAKSEARKPANDTELRFWLENMIVLHGFTMAEVAGATGLSAEEIASSVKRLQMDPSKSKPRHAGDPLLVVPYPGGRHPRIGFLDGAVNPQRETKVSVFTLWEPTGYVVVDVPEAIWSNLGLTYLAHTHVPTVWTKQNIELPRLEWNRHADGSLDFERTLPNGIRFTSKVQPGRDGVRMELTLFNGTKEKLTDLRVQNCVMLKGAPGFTAQTNANKVFAKPYVAVHDETKKRWIITAWEPCHRPWANAPCPCLHSDPKFPDAEPGATVRVCGWLSFYEGDNVEAEFRRLDTFAWRGFDR